MFSYNRLEHWLARLSQWASLPGSSQLKYNFLRNVSKYRALGGNQRKKRKLTSHLCINIYFIETEERGNFCLFLVEKVVKLLITRIQEMPFVHLVPTGLMIVFTSPGFISWKEWKFITINRPSHILLHDDLLVPIDTPKWRKIKSKVPCHRVKHKDPRQGSITSPARSGVQGAQHEANRSVYPTFKFKTVFR